MSELKPCPFCGGKAKGRYDIGTFDQPMYGIGCTNPECHIYTEYGMKLYKTAHEAMRTWNRRATDADN